jgi:hypothetical protein
MTTTAILRDNNDGTWTWSFEGTSFAGQTETATGTCRSKSAASRKLNDHLTSRLEAWLGDSPTADQICLVADHKYGQRNADGSLKY